MTQIQGEECNHTSHHKAWKLDETDPQTTQRRAEIGSIQVLKFSTYNPALLWIPKHPWATPQSLITFPFGQTNVTEIM